MAVPLPPMLKYSIVHKFLNSPLILIKFVWSKFMVCKALYSETQCTLRLSSPLSFAFSQWNVSSQLLSFALSQWNVSSRLFSFAFSQWNVSSRLLSFAFSPWNVSLQWLTFAFLWLVSLALMEILNFHDDLFHRNICLANVVKINHLRN